MIPRGLRRTELQADAKQAVPLCYLVEAVPSTMGHPMQLSWAAARPTVGVPVSSFSSCYRSTHAYIVTCCVPHLMCGSIAFTACALSWHKSVSLGSFMRLPRPGSSTGMT